MTSKPRTRYTTAARHISQQLHASAVILDANAELATCPTARDTMRVCAEEFRRLARILLGDIGEEQTEIESEPVEVPVPVPAEPEKVPA
jgi:hypothetical protein